MVTVPVLGLHHVTDTIPGTRGSRGFVAHLRDNIFFASSASTVPVQPSSPHLRACMFEVTSVVILKGSNFVTRLLVAKNVKEKDLGASSIVVAVFNMVSICFLFY